MEGNVATFCPELLNSRHIAFPDGFAIGNCHRDNFHSTRRSAVFAKRARQVYEGVRACESSCEYFELCGGGAPSNKLFENNSFATTETSACIFNRKAVIDTVLVRLEKIAVSRTSQIRSKLQDGYENVEAT